jgi:hypothetical protein
MLGVLVAVCSLTALVSPAIAPAAQNSAFTAIPSPQGTVEMHVTADCSSDRCTFSTQANLLTPNGPIGFPGETWARQTITLRSTDRSVWQEAYYSAPSGFPLENKEANHDNVLSTAYKSLTDVTISVTYFGGGPLTRFAVDGNSVPTDWRSGRPTPSNFVVCSVIQVVFGGVNLTTPTACAQTDFS